LFDNYISAAPQAISNTFFMPENGAGTSTKANQSQVKELSSTGFTPQRASMSKSRSKSKNNSFQRKGF